MLIFAETTRLFPPILPISSATDSAGAILPISLMTMLAPASASLRAIAEPIPRPLPVTIATLFERSITLLPHLIPCLRLPHTYTQPEKTHHQYSTLRLRIHPFIVRKRDLPDVYAISRCRYTYALVYYVSVCAAPVVLRVPFPAKLK